MCTVRKIPNLLTRIKKHSLLNSSRSPAVTELFANVNVNDKRVSRQKRAVNAFEPPVEKHRVVFTGRAFWTIQRSGLVFFLLFSLLFFSFHSSPSLRSVLVARSTEAQNDGNALFPPPPSRSFHLFRSRHRMPRGDELSLLPPLCSIPIPPLPPFVSWRAHPMADSTVGRIDPSLSRHIHRYTLNTSRRRIYSPRPALPLWWMARRRASLPTLRAYLQLAALREINPKIRGPWTLCESFFFFSF